MKALIHNSKKGFRIGWLIIAILFVVFYSCPVKKFVISHFDTTSSTAATSFVKHSPPVSVKITPIERNTHIWSVIAVNGLWELLPGINFWNHFLPALLIALGLLGISLLFALYTHNNEALYHATGTPLYLHTLRIRV